MIKLRTKKFRDMIPALSEPKFGVKTALNFCTHFSIDTPTDAVFLRFF